MPRLESFRLDALPPELPSDDCDDDWHDAQSGRASSFATARTSLGGMGFLTSEGSEDSLQRMEQELPAAVHVKENRDAPELALSDLQALKKARNDSGEQVLPEPCLVLGPPSPSPARRPTRTPTRSGTGGNDAETALPAPPEHVRVQLSVTATGCVVLGLVAPPPFIFGAAHDAAPAHTFGPPAGRVALLRDEGGQPVWSPASSRVTTARTDGTSKGDGSFPDISSVMAMAGSDASRDCEGLSVAALGSALGSEPCDAEDANQSADGELQRYVDQPSEDEEVDADAALPAALPVVGWKDQGRSLHGGGSSGATSEAAGGVKSSGAKSASLPAVLLGCNDVRALPDTIAHATDTPMEVNTVLVRPVGADALLAAKAQGSPGLAATGMPSLQLSPGTSIDRNSLTAALTMYTHPLRDDETSSDGTGLPELQTSVTPQRQSLDAIVSHSVDGAEDGGAAIEPQESEDEVEKAAAPDSAGAATRACKTLTRVVRKMVPEYPGACASSVETSLTMAGSDGVEATAVKAAADVVSHPLPLVPDAADVIADDAAPDPAAVAEMAAPEAVTVDLEPPAQGSDEAGAAGATHETPAVNRNTEIVRLASEAADAVVVPATIPEPSPLLRPAKRTSWLARLFACACLAPEVKV